MKTKINELNIDPWVMRLQSNAETMTSTGEKIMFQAFLALEINDNGEVECKPGRLGGCIEVNANADPSSRLTWACSEEMDCQGNSIHLLRHLEDAGLIETDLHEVEGEPHCHWDFTGFKDHRKNFGAIDLDDEDEVELELVSFIEEMLPDNL